MYDSMFTEQDNLSGSTDEPFLRIMPIQSKLLHRKAKSRTRGDRPHVFVLLHVKRDRSSIRKSVFQIV